jgi:hypothetical protein
MEALLYSAEVLFHKVRHPDQRPHQPESEDSFPPLGEEDQRVGPADQTEWVHSNGVGEDGQAADISRVGGASEETAEEGENEQNTGLAQSSQS